MNAFLDGDGLLNTLNLKRNKKKESIIKQNKIYYTPQWIPNGEKQCISSLYDKLLTSNPSYHDLKQFLKHKYPKKRIVPKLNQSIYKIIRSKDAIYDEF